MHRKPLVIIGDSAFAEIAREYFDNDSPYKVEAFCVEREFLKRGSLHGLPVVALDDLTHLYPSAQHEVFVAIPYTQMNRLRTRLSQKAKNIGYRLASYVSSRAFVWRNVTIGEHCFIFEDNTVQPFVSIGNNVVMWSGNHIGHHSRIGDNCFISSHAVVSGFCDIGANSFLGVNCTISNNVRIERDNWIGPGITVLRDTEVNALFRAPKSEPSKVATLEYFKVKE